MDGTCNFKECFFAELLDRREQCPNFIQTWWTPDKGVPKLVDDCAPKRTMIMLQEQYGRLSGIQKAQEQQRNAVAKIVESFPVLAELASGGYKKIGS